MPTKSPWLIEPHRKVRLAQIDASRHDGVSKKAAAAALERHRDTLATQQQVLYAGQQRAVLLVLQGMDTAGKDGTISHIFSGINPQGCEVASFKVPTPLEAAHDFLWRCHQKTPARGMITVFNRSHYEQVLSPRVHGIITPKLAREQMRQINDFEAMLAANGTLILKFFLHISAEEQTRRLEERLSNPDKQWKFSAADLKERALWPAYQDAYEDIFERTSKRVAPWFVIPANHKWYRNHVIAGILADALSGMKLAYPKPTIDPASITL